jgi:hypothetical protein
MIEKDDSSYYSFSHQDGECSRVVEAKRTSDEEVLHKQLALPSSPEKGNMCKASPEKDVHARGEGMKTFPTGEWSSYPCASYGTRNHDVEKCRRRQSVQVKPSKKKENHFSSQRKRRNDKKGSWNKTLCSYCGKSGHQIEKCWTLYPHLCPKKNMKYVKTLARRQATTPDEVNGLTERLGKEYFLMVGLGKVIYEDIKEWFMDKWLISPHDRDEINIFDFLRIRHRLLCGIWNQHQTSNKRVWICNIPARVRRISGNRTYVVCSILKGKPTLSCNI